MNKFLVVPVFALLLVGGAFAFDADFAFNLQEAINSFLVDWTGDYTSDLSGEVDQVFYLAGSSSYSSCSGGAVLWTSNISNGSINFTVSDIYESGMDLKLQIEGTEYDLNSSQTEYSFPITAIDQRVCLKAIGKQSGDVRISTSDFNVMEG